MSPMEPRVGHLERAKVAAASAPCPGEVLNSSIGAKIVVAVTGAFLLLFVIGHMLGNLQIFIGQEAFNAYAAFLKSKGGLLWGVRLFLGAMLAVHVGCSLLLALKNRQARPVPYAFEDTVQASYASRTMVWSGPVILAFVAYHLLHFTVGKVQPEYFAHPDAQGRHDVYSMVILGFQHKWVAGSYIVAMLLLGMHLWHGASSLFQTLGVSCPRLDPLLARAGPFLAVLLVGGYLSIPLAVLAGILKPGTHP